MRKTWIRALRKEDEEVYIAETERHVDIVVETEEGRFIVIEVKATRNSDAITHRFDYGKKQIKDYMRLVEQYGLDLSKAGKREPVKDVDSYWVFVVYFDLENKVAKAFHDILPKD